MVFKIRQRQAPKNVAPIEFAPTAMPSRFPDRAQAPVELVSQDGSREPSWAHVSGWAQLSGSRQTVSCILICANQAPVVAQLLPLLSDSLTESGYPWEIIAVDAGSTDDTLAVLSPWIELPGIRILRMDSPQDTAPCLAASLLRARGDAVICVDPVAPHSPDLIPQMILLWESEAMLVHARYNAAQRRSSLVHWDETEMHQRIAHPDFILPPECTQLGLLDRQLIDWMVQGG